MIDPCDINGNQAVSDHLVSDYSERMRYLADDLLHGTLSLDDWHARMQDAIRLAYMEQAIAGTRDSDERELKMADMRRIEADIVDQYKYLHGFVNAIEASIEKDGASLDFIPGRAVMYAESSSAEYWRQAVQVDLPHFPGDGSTQCLGKCSCSVRTECEYDDQGNVIAVLVYWDLDPDKEEVHCEDCPARAEEWNPLRIPVGANV